MVKSLNIFVYLLLFIFILIPQSYAKNNIPTTQDHLRTILDKDPPGEGTLIREADENNAATAIALKHTNVKMSIVGFVASVDVEQIFINPYSENIMATYIFPLPSDSAIHKMEMLIGDREIQGEIKERDFAKEEMQRVSKQGNKVVLLEQERPNIFTSTVANIEPTDKITVRIHYTQRLSYDDGAFRIFFPMVVGHRYIPGIPIGKSGKGENADTTRVRDASRITVPRVSTAGELRIGNVSISIDLNPGIKVKNVFSPSHQVLLNKAKKNGHFDIKLAKFELIPNRDFILEYEVAGTQPSAALLTAEDLQKNVGYFLLMATPPAKATKENILPKDLDLILDISGSMSGQTLEQAKKALKMCLDGLNPEDTFNISVFADQFHSITNTYLFATKENIKHATQFINKLETEGGTKMFPVLEHTLIENLKNKTSVKLAGRKLDRLPIIVMFSDGGVGNEQEILNMVEKNLGDTRIFTFGISDAINDYFMHKLAEFGRGTSEMIPSSQENIEPNIKRFLKRLHAPILSNFKIDWPNSEKAEISPSLLPDLFYNKPVFIIGRYPLSVDPQNIQLTAEGTNGLIDIPLNFDLDSSELKLEILSTLWARAQMEDLTDKILQKPQDEFYKQQLLALALEYQLLSPVTAFIAIDQFSSTDGNTTEVTVPVLVPRSWEAAPLLLTASLSSPNPALACSNQGIAPKFTQLKGKIFIPVKRNTGDKIFKKNKPNKGYGKLKPTSSKNNPTKTPSTNELPPFSEEDKAILSSDANNKEKLLAKLLSQQLPTGEWQGSNTADALRNTALATLVLIENHRAKNTKYLLELQLATDFLISNVDGFGRIYSIEGVQQETETYALVILALSEYLRTVQNSDDSSLAGKKELSKLLLDKLLSLRKADRFWLNKEEGKEDLNATLWAILAVNSASSNKVSLGEIINLLTKQKESDNLLKSSLIMTLGGFKFEDKNLAELKNYMFTAFLKNTNLSNLSSEDSLFAMMLIKKLSPRDILKFKAMLIKNLPFSPTTNALASRYLTIAMDNTKLESLR